MTTTTHTTCRRPGRRSGALLLSIGACASILTANTTAAHAAPAATPNATNVVSRLGYDVFATSNPTTGGMFLSRSATEVKQAAPFGFTQNAGVLFDAGAQADPGLEPIHQVWSKTGGFAFIPEGAELTAAIGQQHFTDRGVAFYASRSTAAGLVPVYRLRSPHGQFSYTLDKDTVAKKLSAGWKEGFAAFWVKPAGTSATIPGQASAAGYTARTFNTDFTSLAPVDLTGKGDLTKQWFTDRAWNPNLPASNLKMVDGGMQISPDTNNGPNYDLATASHNGNGGHGFKYGYFQTRMKFNADQRTTAQTKNQTGGWPSWWLYAYDAMRTQNLPHANEIDALEYFNDTVEGGLHRYTGGVWDHNAGVDTGSGSDSTSNDPKFPAGHDPNGWNTYGLLWTPGKVQWDIDGVVSKTITYGKTVHPAINGVVQTALPVGMFSHLDEDPNGVALVLGTGHGDPITVSNVQVWQKK